MLSNRKITYTATLDIDNNAVGFLLGKGRKNLNGLKQDYPDVNIWTSANGPFTSFNLSSNSATKLDLCKSALEKLKYNAESVHQSIVQRKRVTKNIEIQRQNIIAGKKIRESMENEMRTKHRDEVQRKIFADLQHEVKEEKEAELSALPVKNMFGGLEVE
jgi:hypothetical protein